MHTQLLHLNHPLLADDSAAGGLGALLVIGWVVALAMAFGQRRDDPLAVQTVPSTTRYSGCR